MRLIDAEQLIHDIKHGLWDWESVNGITARTVLEQTIQDIKNMPTINAEIIEDRGKFRCYSCLRSTVIWDNDFSYEDYGIDGNGIVQTYHCTNCGAEIEVYIPIEEVKENEVTRDREETERQDTDNANGRDNVD